MSYVLRCMDGGCFWGYTLPDFKVAEQTAKSHVAEMKDHIVVILDTVSDIFYQTTDDIVIEINGI